MVVNSSIWDIIDSFLKVIHDETGFPVVIYDTRGRIIKATDDSRIGDLHSGAEKIMHDGVSEFAVGKDEADLDPSVKEGYSFPIIVKGEIVAGFGITGKLELVAPLAKIASKMIDAWVKEQSYIEQLTRSEKKYRNIFNHSLDGIFQTNQSGRVLTANPALAKILEYDSPEELVEVITDVSSQFYVNPEDRTKLLSLLRDRGYITHFVTQGRKKDGTVIDIRIDARTMLDPETNTTIIEGVVEDITEKNRAEAALRISEEKFSKAFNLCPLWVVLSSLETGRYIDTNETFLRTLGYTRDEVIGKTSLEIGTWVNPEERVKIVEEIKKHSRIADFEVTRRAKDGRLLDMLFWGDMIEIAGEACLLSVSLDITERKRTELQKAHLERALAHSQKLDAIGQLTSGIAHDFNNMIGGILGAAEMLSFFLPDDPKAKKFHQMILEAGGRSADLTKKLLAFSRNNPPVSSTVDIHKIMEETLVLLENTIDRRISLRAELNAPESLVVGEPSQLQNVFLNLGINSSQAMHEGGELTISSRNVHIDSLYCKASPFDLHSGHYIELEVRDTGTGIAQENFRKIFEPFFTTKSEGTGTGLGLSVVYGSVQQHKGAITVCSELGVGTVFNILLPIAQQEETTKQSGPNRLKGSGRVLVVDDEEIMRVTAKAILEELGYEVVLAQNGEEALVLYKSATQPFELVILDMVMPIMNGRDCFIALKEYNPEISVILSSGFTREDDLESLKTAGLNGFIRKPYSGASLSHIVHEVMNRQLS